jgi:ribosomal protein S18 acetylase RimI-like enzyme
MMTEMRKYLPHTSQKSFMMLDNIMVLSKYRSRNIGSRMIQKVQSIAKLASSDIAMLVLKENVRAKKLYTKLGFSTVIPNRTKELEKYNIMYKTAINIRQ